MSRSIPALRLLGMALTGACALLAASSGALAAEQIRSILISRHATLSQTTSASFLPADFNLELRVSITDGKLEGDGRLFYTDVTSGQGGPIKAQIDAQVRASGTFADDRVQLRVTGPETMTYLVTEAPPTDDPKNIVHVGSTLNLPLTTFEEFIVFDATLVKGRFEATETRATPGGPWHVVTKMEASAVGGAIEVKAEHEIIPGHLAYYNKISFRLPDTQEIKDAIAKEKEGAEAVAEVATHGRGRLSKEVGEWGHLREQRFEKVVPGQWYDLYYSWDGEGPAPAHKERIKVSVPTLELEGEAGFDVGVDFEVVSVERMMQRPPEISRPEPLRVKVREALHPQKNAAALAKELGLKPELSIEQTGYEPHTTLADIIEGFSINSSGVAELVAAAMTGKGKALITGDKLTWNVGDGDVLAGSDGLGYPTLRFQQRGLFFFDFNITGLAYTPYGGGVMREPKSPAKDAMIAVTELDANTQFLVNVLVPCMQGMISAAKEAATADPLEGWKALWECLKSGLGSDLAQQALADHVLINAVAIWLADMIDGGVSVAEAAGETLKPQTVEDVQDQVIEQAQAIAEEMSDMVIAAVSKDGLVSKTAASDRAGKLAPGPKSIDLTELRAKGPADRARASQYASQKRIQEGKRFVVIPASGGETVKLDLAGDGKPGEIIVISKSQVTRAKYPAGKWASKLEIGRDGVVRTLGGTPLETTTEPARKKAAGPESGSGLLHLAANDAEAGDQPAAEDLWNKIKEKAVKPPSGAVIGGPCEYTDISGTALIQGIEKTDASAHQATVGGGPGYEGLEVRYSFAPDAAIADAKTKAWAESTHMLQLTNSWYPGLRYLEKYAITLGKTFPATLKVISKGSCTPFAFDIQGVDRSDYFETVK